MPAKIVLVASEADDIQNYLSYLQVHEVDVRVVPSFAVLEKVLSEESYNGIVVDLKTKLKTSRDQKELAYELMMHYPVLQARLIGESKKMQALPFGKASRDVSLETFLNEVCPGFEARKLRSNIRRNIHFNVLLSRTGDFSAKAVEKTVTLNVSSSGCYIISFAKEHPGNSLSFIIKELTSQTPIIGEVRWHIPWGKQITIPGIGIKFEDIEENQMRELDEKYHLK